MGSGAYWRTAVLVACIAGPVAAASCGGKVASVAGDAGVPGSGTSGSATGSSSGLGGGGPTGSAGGGTAPTGSVAPGGGVSPGGSGSTGTGGSSGGGGPPDAGAGCGAPPSLQPQQGGTIFCGASSAGVALLCDSQEECCLGGTLGAGQYAPEECAPLGATCTNGTGPIAIACNQIADCRQDGLASTACCLQGAHETTVAGCGYPKFSGGTAIACEGSGGGSPTSCAAGETQVCSSQADCPTGTTCTAGKWKIYQLGFCL